MKIKFANNEFEGTLTNGEYRRYADEGYGEYLCVGIFGNNRVLFQYIDTMNEAVDYVQGVIDNIPDFAMDYLVNVLNENNDILIRLTLYPQTPTGFEIYYNCQCEENDVQSLIAWMGEHNDFEAEEYRYTEIIDGHQKCIGE